ncbi:unnamed protein product [Allacma fusca]|uniref:Diacylglycerol O-acyltransferase n=1 Tax=Allacma fusca TaxID=39272 RepID=A0A8J2NSJ3_9HEXA|nr:unnamed protein product [Allacma fusca]
MTVILRTIYIAVCCILLVIFTIFTLPWRFFVYILARIWKPELQDFATGISRIFSGTVQFGNLLPLNTTTVLTVEGYLDLENFRGLFHKRVLQKRNKNGGLVFGRFYEIITFFMGYPFWTKEKNFNLANHIETYDYRSEGIDCFDENRLKEYLSDLKKKHWDKQSSYWKITLIHNYNGKAQTLIIMTWQHSLGDGFSMKNVLECMFLGDKGHQNSDHKNNIYESDSSIISLSQIFLRLTICWEALKSVLLFPYESARFKEEVARTEVALWEINTNAGEDEYHFNFTKPFPVDSIKSVRAKFSVGFQTVLNSALTAGLEKALKKCKQPITTGKILIDSSKPRLPHPEGLTNHFFFGNLCVPLTATSPQDRLLQTERSYQAQRTSNIPLGFHYALQTASLLPGNLPFVCGSFLHQFVHMVFTSFPYFGKIDLEGCAVSDLFTVFAGPHPSSHLTALATGSPNQVKFGLSLRKCVSSLPSEFLEILRLCIEEEMERFLSLGDC